MTRPAQPCPLPSGERIEVRAGVAIARPAYPSPALSPSGRGEGGGATDVRTKSPRRGQCRRRFRRRAAGPPARSRRRPDQQLHDQLRAAAPGRARRPPADHGARRRDRRARRPAYRPAPSRHREADRVQDLRPGAALLRPARLLLADVHGAQLRARDREIDGPRGPAARPIYPRADGRADPHLQPHAQPRQPHHGRRRDDARTCGCSKCAKTRCNSTSGRRARGCTPITSAPAACATI